MPKEKETVTSTIVTKASTPIEIGLLKGGSLTSADFEENLSLDHVIEESFKTPLVIQVNRRATCPLCLITAQHFNAYVEDFEALGFSTMIILQTHMNCQELQSHAPNTTVWIDTNHVIFRALGRGKLKNAKASNFLSFKLFKQLWNARNSLKKRPPLFPLATTPWNAKTMVLGGYLIIKDGKVVYDYSQKVLEDELDLKVLLEEAKRVAPTTQTKEIHGSENSAVIQETPVRNETTPIVSVVV